MVDRRLYVDHNATSPPASGVVAAMDAAREVAWANPDSPHAAGRAAAAAVDEARAAVAALLGGDPRAVVFTSGATEGNAWVLAKGAARGRVLVSAVEHPSVLAWGHERVPVDGQGVVDLEHLRARLSEGDVGLVSVMAANNETGVIQPQAAVAELARAHGALVHCDASQIPGRIRPSLDADFITVSAHKFGGPQGVGAVLARVPLPPLLKGGPQERGRRAGTTNVVGIVGMGAAARLARVMEPGPRDALQEACIRLGGQVLSGEAPRLPNTLSVLFGVPGDLVVIGLDLEGVCASTGSACASGSSQPSHVVAAMGRSGTPVRFSLGPDSDVDAVARCLARVIRRMEAV